MSIPSLSFSSFRFSKYSLVRVGRLFTSSTTRSHIGPFPVQYAAGAWYVKSALYRMARTRRPSVSVYAMYFWSA